MVDIVQNFIHLREQIPANVKIVAVSKSHPASDILTLYNAGHKIFGENRVQELLEKKEILPDDIEWHLIGHLQTNKVRAVIPHVKLIHSVDSFKLLSVIDKEAEKAGLTVECLLQFHIAKEETKTGFSFREAQDMLESEGYLKIKNINITGVMGIATFTKDMKIVRDEFRTLKNYFNVLKSKYFNNNPLFRELSMGMSGDFKIAIEEGSTIVRIGTLIFGERYV
ncbi:MAG TPA: YggS family pyridoxal phosphate-dependent enzyme [Bacteroidales bacterium]|nr:YggS family pyridoxal phosphate-dependent enzyme [Bacteroidales bacterium]HCI54571.1 YggS family pyridoxal phosphate-dependent enzyme [Bacteroidales bacterium]HOU95255.1 YggS family pyridoxal phosphate-dependent enzyme [Bacteroidales bacterium]HQG35591.1 YggS family pyridoxal phosphate-dependent enzyme [Bacteroidales bacterium]HQG51901.1 YggS family pyridoxal phosphate-dependent enzyme [Bacteroidales bacterium]